MEYYNHNYLIHHGIKGQSWGVRNGPPYPLDSGDHNARERKAGWRSSLKGNKKELTDEERAARNAKIKKLIKYSLIAAGTFYVGYKFTDLSYNKMLSSELTKLGFEHLHSEKYKEKLLQSVKTLTDHNKDADFEIINKTESSIETLHKAAQDPFSLSGKEQYDLLKDTMAGRLTNCVYCTNAAALRRMGYDVSAGTTRKGLTSAQMLKYWKGAEVNDLYGHKLTSVKDVKTFIVDRHDNPILLNYESIFERNFSKMPNGAFGEFTVMGNASGHSVEWFKEGNTVKIFDNQMKIKYDSISDFFKQNALSGWDEQQTSYIRYDNCEPNIPLMIHDGIIKARGN